MYLEKIDGGCTTVEATQLTVFARERERDSKWVPIISLCFTPPVRFERLNRSP